LSVNYLASIPEAEEFADSEGNLRPRVCGHNNVINHDCFDSRAFSDDPLKLGDNGFPSLESCPMPTFSEAAEKPFRFLDLVQSILQTVEAAHVGLRDFLRLSRQLCSRTVQKTESCLDLWPCPLPSARWTASPKLSPRRRHRHRFLKLRTSLLQHIIGVLNWECLGHPVKPPLKACCGNPFTDSQWSMVCRLERLVDHFLMAGDVSSCRLGRSSEKFEGLLQAAKELPVCQEVGLFRFAKSVASGLNPYGPKEPPECTPKQSSFSKDPAEPQSKHQCFPGKKVSSEVVVSAKPVVARRIKWEHSPQCDPVPFLRDDIVKQAFLDPDSVKLPSHLWTRKPKGKVHCSRTELLNLASKWDCKGACKIFRVDEVNLEETVGMFAVSKDDVCDRLILNPQLVNGRMQSFSHYTKELAPGSMFALLHLQPNQVFRASADDLAEMYYTFKVPTKRARRNCIGLIFDASCLKHLSCFDPSRHYGQCLVALSALAMGDSWAVEFAQQSHHNVLRSLAGSMLEHERVAYRKPFPRTHFCEWLAIDDHIGVQILEKEDFKKSIPARDTEVFSRAEGAYKRVGLVQHPKKKQRNVVAGTFLGAEVDGEKGLVSAPRDRIAALMLCTAVIAQRGTTSPRLLSSILGSWIHVLMFRRPILAIASHVFTEGSGFKAEEVFCLSRVARNEFLALSLLGPMCVSDLRVDIAPFIYCTDASPYGGGICVASEGIPVVKELWRHCEQRGYYSGLLNPSGAILSELGLEPATVALPELGEPVETSIRIPKALHEKFLFDCLELFRGEGNWTLAHEDLGLTSHPGVDVAGKGVFFGDLLDDSVFHILISLALRRVVREWHAGPPCKSFGTLRRPRVRSKLFPGGFRVLEPFTREHNRLAWRTAFLMQLVIQGGNYFSVEQPGSSVMFRLDAFRRLISQGCVITSFCFCQFGSPFKKPSKWLHNKPWLLELECKCTCKSASEHFVIQGTFTSKSLPEFEKRCKPSSVEVYGRPPRLGEQVSSYSASYPKSLCRLMAAGSVQAREGPQPIIPLSAVIRSLEKVGVSVDFPTSILSAEIIRRPFHEDPHWVGELSDSLHFRELLRFKFLKQGHINVLECRVHKTWLKHCARVHPNSRTVALLDSRVTLGATSKGRSSSRAICRVLQGSLGYILGGCLYPGGIHIASAKNRSDPPSRNRPVAPPSKESPAWLDDLRASRFDRFDRVLEASNYSGSAQLWLRLLLLLAGDIERNPGPRQQGRRRGPNLSRGDLDLNVGFQPATSKRMSACLVAFNLWLQRELKISIDELAWDFTAAPLALRAYGLDLFKRGDPRYLFVYTITGFQDQYPHMKPHLNPVWQIDRKWQQHEPGSCRAVISAPIMRAITSLCLLWGWHRWLVVTLIGFLGMLHASEFLDLVRRDVLLPGDSLLGGEVFYVHIRQPKTARFARRQHCKIDDLMTLLYVQEVIGDLHPGERIFPGSSNSYRRLWNLVLQHLQIPSTQRERGATPGVLRGSGATHMYLECEDLSRVQWRGRWSQLRTVEHYVQEVAAQTMLSRLPSFARHRIATFNAAAPDLLLDFLSTSRSAQNAE